MDPQCGKRGRDGLTEEELRTSRRGWWDRRFTERLVDAIPADSKVLVEVGCGLASAAHALLPAFSHLKYIGIDVDEDRIAAARRTFETAPYADRVELAVGRAERLPCRDGEADVVLFAMTLQHLRDVVPALDEARRILVASGTLVAVEPDNLGQRFYFDSPLDEVNRSMADLACAARERRRPVDPAVGPAIPAALSRAGFQVSSCTPYCLGALRPTSARQVLESAARVADVIAAAAGLDPDDAGVVACRDAIERARATFEPEASGCGGQIVPVFVTVARSVTGGTVGT